MINKAFSVIFAALLMSLAGTAMATADESPSLDGTIEIGARSVGDAEDSAQYQEFRTMDTPVFGNVHLNVEAADHYLRLDAEIAGDDDLSFLLKGGKYGSYKFRINYDKMPHNYYFDAITPASGMGSDFIVYPLLGSVADLDEWWREWKVFDYSVTHESYGAAAEVSFKTPFYFSIAVERQEDDGKRPYSTRYFTEVAEPVSTTTDNLSARFGYADENVSASISGSLSQFENDFPFMRWSAPDDGDIAEIVFSPDNDLKKLAADLTWRNLPLNSVLAAAISNSWLETDYTAKDIGFDITASDYNRDDFDGDVEYTTVSLTLVSRPIDKLNTKLYYRYVERDNNSSIITYSGGNTTNSDELLSYDKNVFGINAGYRLPGRNKLDVGYEYLEMERSTPSGDAIPANETRDDKVFVQLKNSSLDWMTAKLRYTYMERDSSKMGRQIDTITPNTFYYMDQSSGQLKLALEFYPMDKLDLGLNFSYKKIDYDYSIDTRQEEERRSTYLDADWRVSDLVTLRGFAGIEYVDIDANRVDNNQTVPQRGEEVREDFWTYGLGVDYQATSRLRFDVAWQYQKSDGEVNFDNSYTGSDWMDIDHSDDYTKKQLEAKAIYAITDAIDLTLCYLYEKFDYSDRNYANYPYNYLVEDGEDAILSGLYSDMDYEVNAAYLTVRFTF